MRATEILLGGLVLWTAIGVVGTAVSVWGGQRVKAWGGVRWIVGVWVVYLLVLVGVSLRQRQRVMSPGEEQCFDEMCFSVVGVEEVEGFRARGQAGERLLRVGIAVRNRSLKTAESEGLIRAYLLDGQGRRWMEVKGLGGVRLTARVPAGGRVVSEPVFEVGRDASGISLVLTHGRWQPDVLVIGSAESWLHRRTLMRLGR